MGENREGQARAREERPCVPQEEQSRAAAVIVRALCGFVRNRRLGEARQINLVVASEFCGKGRRREAARADNAVLLVLRMNC